YMRRKVKQMISECHDNYIRNTEDKLKTNTKCFFSYTKSIRKTNSLPANLSHNGDTTNDRISACDLFARFFDSVYQRSGVTHDVFEDGRTDRVRLTDKAVSEDDVKSILGTFDCNK